VEGARQPQESARGAGLSRVEVQQRQHRQQHVALRGALLRGRARPAVGERGGHHGAAASSSSSAALQVLGEGAGGDLLEAWRRRQQGRQAGFDALRQRRRALPAHPLPQPKQVLQGLQQPEALLLVQGRDRAELVAAQAAAQQRGRAVGARGGGGVPAVQQDVGLHLVQPQRDGGVDGGVAEARVDGQRGAAAQRQLRLGLHRLLGGGVGALEAQHPARQPGLVLLERGGQGCGLDGGRLELDRFQPLVQPPERRPMKVDSVKRHDFIARYSIQRCLHSRFGKSTVSCRST
jgi:hypothetical protein